MRPILFSVGAFGIAAAPVFAGFAALASFFYFDRRKAGLGLNDEDFWAVIASLATGVFAGALGFYVLAYGGGVAINVSRILRTRSIAGGSFLGTYLGAIIASGLVCRARRIKFGPIADMLGGAAPLGLAVMRVGCLLNGCCYGKPTDLPWGIVFHGRSGVPPALRGIHLHPTQIYEALGSLAVFALVDRVVRPRIAAGKLRSGDGLAVSVALYAVLRFFVDFLRAGDPGVVAPLGLSLAQWIALLAAAGAIVRFAGRRA